MKYFRKWMALLSVATCLGVFSGCLGEVADQIQCRFEDGGVTCDGAFTVPIPGAV